jgi:CSLREA domain-containing protein
MRFIAAALAAAVVCLAWPATSAAAPANDDFAAAETIGSLPFSDTETDVQNATLETFGDPLQFCRRNSVQGANTVWYRYTTGAGTTSSNPEYLLLDTSGSTYDTVIAVFEGGRNGRDMPLGGCSDRFGGREQAVVRLDRPSTEYYVEVAAPSAVASPATLQLAASAAPRYEVTTAADGAPGACDASCTLREAIAASNASPGVVLLPGAGPYALSAGPPEAAGLADNARGDLDVTGSGLVEGTGAAPAAIAAGGLDRVLHLQANGTLALRNVELAGGSTSGDGGGLYAERGFADLDLATVRDSVSGGAGGGIAVVNDVMRAQRSTLSGNTATGGGGGLFVSQFAEPVWFVDGAILANGRTGATTTTPVGGGALVQANTSLVNVTVSGNAAGARGGGVLVTQGTVFLIHATVADNAAGIAGGGLRIDSGGATVHGSAIADNSAPADADCSDANSAYSGFMTVRESAGTCAVAATETIADPQLRPLGDYGGPTLAQPPRAGGPAIDAEALTGSGTCLADGWLEVTRGGADQRGLARPVDGDASGDPQCDAGAVEGQPPACEDTSLAVDQDTPGEIALPCSDPDGDPVTALVFDTSPAKGALSGTGLTSRTYTPNPGATGSDVFAFHATAGGLDSPPATAAITIKPVAAAPPAPADPAPPPPPPPPCCAPAPDLTAPAFQGPVVVRPSRFAPAAGAAIAYSLTEAATVTFSVERATLGRKVGGRCVKPSRRNRRRSRCTRYARVGRAFTHQGQAGRNSLRFARGLRLGRYRLVAVAKDAAGNVSTVRRTSFRIARR